MTEHLWWLNTADWGRILKTPLFILSDFGYSDTYVAQMKAAILSFAGYDTPVIDLTHMVEPGNILQGAYHLRSSLPHLPKGSVTLAVVDPGVGSSRLGLAAFWRGRFIVAPDNGLITMLSDPVKIWKLPPPESDSAPTFHGRDVFAVCAARLAVDPGWTSFLEQLESPVLLSGLKPVFQVDSMSVVVIHVDHFGNCILGVEADEFMKFDSVSVSTSAGDFTVFPVTSYYQAPASDTVLSLRGSQGFFELALNGSSAAEKLGVSTGHRVTLKGKWINHK